MKSTSLTLPTLVLTGLLCLLSAPAFALDYPAEVMDHLRQGNEYLTKGNLVKARKELEAALKIEPCCPEAYNNIGLCYMRQGTLDKAAEQFRLALKHEPLFLPSLNNLGSVLYRQKRYDEAVVFYQQALSLCKNGDAEIHTNLANVLRDKGDYSTALEHYRQAVKLQPDFAPAYNNLGLTLYHLHRYPEALVEITKAIKLKPRYSEAYFNLGLLQRSNHKFDEAKQAFQKSLEYETNPAYAADTRRCISELSAAGMTTKHLESGYRSLQRRQWKKAQDEYQQALAQQNDDAIAWNNLGLAFLQQGKLDEAIGALQKAISIIPKGFPAAQYNLGQALNKSGYNEQAEKAFRQALKDAKGTHALSYNMLGTLMTAKGDFGNSIRSYKLAILQSGDTLPVAHYNLALALEKSNSPKEAAREYHAYLLRSPQGLNATNARLHLRKLGVN